MLELDGYTFEKQIGTSPSSQVYLGRRDADGVRVVAKLYHDPTTAAAESEAGRERALLERICSDHVVRPLGVELCGHRWALVTEHVAGVPTNEIFDRRPFDVGVALEVALGVCEALADIHGARIVHKDIKPSNIVVDPETLRVTIIDLGIADELGTAQDSVVPEVARGTCHYVAPEQSGRMRCGVDFRSDLYSFGATLYELLVGAPPFTAENVGKILHAHLARKPKPPHELRPQVPELLSRIVLRCLEKRPEDRYQTADGLAADLRTCRDQWKARGALDPEMELGARDRSHVIRFPSALYGRDAEIELLESALAKTRERPQLVLIAGGGGVGKSSLAQHVEKRVALDGGFHAAAKFDAQHRDVPYSAFTQALSDLAEQLLVETSRNPDQGFTARLRGELGNLTQVLAELAPSFGTLLGETADLPEIGSVEAAARICLTLKRLVAAVTREGETLAISLDDLQWADAGSRELLRDFPTWAGEAPILLVGTFRDEELPQNSVLDTLVRDLCALREPATLLSLGPLCVADSNAFLAAALEREPGETLWLAERLAAKTGNNPFYLKQMVLHLRSEELIRPAPRGWDWDRDAILSTGVFDDAAHFLATKMQGLVDVKRDVLKVASCVGDVFETEQIRELSSLDRMVIHRALADLTTDGFLSPCREGFRFVHGRIREAAGSLLAPVERAALHAQVVRPILERNEASELRARAFEIADHVRLAQPALGEHERIPAARCYLRAALRSLAAGSPGSAASYLDTALGWVQETDWDTARDLMFDLHLHRAEVHALLEAPDAAETVCRALLKREHTPLQQARLDAVWIFAGYLREGAAIERAIEACARIGVRIPRKPSRLVTSWSMRRLRRTTDGKSDEVYLRRPDGSDWRLTALLILYRRAAISLFRSHRPGMLNMVNEILRRIQASGAPRAPGYLLASAALLESTIGGDAKRLQSLNEQVLRLKEARPDPQTDHRCEIVVHAICAPWYRSMRRSIDPLRRAMESAAEIGDSTYHYAARLNDVTFRFMSGAPLAEVQARADLHLAAIPGVEVHATYLLRGYARATRLLRGVAGAEGTNPALVRATFSYLPQNRAAMRVTQMFVSLLLGPQLDDPDDDGEGFAKFRLRDAFGNSPPIVLGFALLQGLDAANRLLRGSRTRLHKRLLIDRERRLQKWAKHAPENFAAAASMLAAESARLRGHLERAIGLFAQARECALENGQRHFAAIASEREAQTLSKAGDRGASRAFERTIALYGDWGADAKVQRMRAKA